MTTGDPPFEGGGATMPEAAAVDTLVFLDVDGVLHPLGTNHLPVGCAVDDLVARADAELERSVDDPLYEYPVFAGEFTPRNMDALAALVRRVPRARVVLTSTWREQPWTRRAVVLALRAAGVPGSCVRVLSEAEEAAVRAVRAALPCMGEDGFAENAPPADGMSDAQSEEYYTQWNIESTPVLCPSRRAAEIAVYLAGHARARGVEALPVRYAIVDDADLTFAGTAAPLAPHFVHVDPGRGLTDSDVDRIVEVLGRTGASPRIPEGGWGT